MVLHSFVSDEARQLYLTPPEIREPAEERATEYQWAEASKGGICAVLANLGW